MPGAGKPLEFEDDSHIPEDLRLPFKILKNADCLPPEIEIKKEIERTEDLLAGMSDTAERYRTMKRLNYLILKLNSTRTSAVPMDVPQKYMVRLTERLEAKHLK
ncbi:MAG: DnaJ family domain-containing protein [Desulfococcaceae bacterium]